MKKILFVCTVNRMRSATAHKIFADHPDFEVQSAGTAPEAARVIDRELLEWADAIVVMERHHRSRIRKLFPDLYERKKIVCLYIPDEYDFMQEELMSILKERFENVRKKGLI